MDPIAFRRKNLRADDAPGPIGQELVGRPPVHATLDALERLCRRPPPAAPPAARWRHARGAALITKNDGLGKAMPQASRVRLTLREDGRIEAAMSLVDMGQGVNGAAALATRRALGVAGDDVICRLGDSMATPDAGPTVADRGAGALHRAVACAAPDFRNLLLSAAALRLGLCADALALGPGGIWRDRTGDNGPVMSFADLAREGEFGVEGVHPGRSTPSDMPEAAGTFVAAGAVADLWIDSATGRVVVEALDVAVGAGPVMSPRRYRAQLEGGLAMGMGFAVTERLGSAEGRFSASNIDSYLPPGFADAPHYRVEPVEALLAGDAIEPRGVGEIGVIVGAAAIGVAASNAIAAPITRFPLDPAALRAALRTPAFERTA